MKMDFETALLFLKERISVHLALRPLVIAIDGRAASGKTTFAERLSNEIDVTVIHTDDFFRPRDSFGKLKISEYDGNFDIERFRDEVVNGIASGKPFVYGRYDCKIGKIVEKICCDKASCFVVEGSYSQNPKLGDYADIKLFFDIDKQTQRERIISRNGKNAFQNFCTMWIPAEERYFEKYNIVSNCDIVISTKVG